MKINWIIEKNDIQNIREFYNSQVDRPFVQKRMEKNIIGPVPVFDRHKFWYGTISCLITTQQRSGPNSPVSKFICTQPFPLDLNKCKDKLYLNEFVEDTITNFGGLRRSKTLGNEIQINFEWLEMDGWRKIENMAKILLKKRRGHPHYKDKFTERIAAELVINNLKGFGPKQSRNLWQFLGLTRFEIPIDSRITKWFNINGFPVKLSASALGDKNYYNFVMDGIQEICRVCGIYPCVLDAAIFASFDLDWPEDKLIW